MNIQNHLIKEYLIIGISPIYHKEHPDMALRNTYRPVRLIFDIHTKFRTIEIQSDWFEVGHREDNLSPKEKEGRILYKEFEDKYYELRKKIAIMIGEPEEEQNRFDNPSPLVANV